MYLKCIAPLVIAPKSAHCFATVLVFIKETIQVLYNLNQRSKFQLKRLLSGNKLAENRFTNIKVLISIGIYKKELFSIKAVKLN